jgi:protein ImuA
MSSVARSSFLNVSDIHADVWHADALGTPTLQVRMTGDSALDAQLPGGGWPVGAMTEILQAAGVHSEWRLLLPALVGTKLAVLLVGPPHLPFAPALAAQGLNAQRLLVVSTALPAQRLWATEQALRCAEVDAVLLWLPLSAKDPVRTDQLRRLQIAAAEHQKLLFVMRPDSVREEASPAALRMWVGPKVSTGEDALEAQLHKRRGPPMAGPLVLRARAPRLGLLLAAAQNHALDRATART